MRSRQNLTFTSRRIAERNLGNWFEGLFLHSFESIRQFVEWTTKGSWREAPASPQSCKPMRYDVYLWDMKSTEANLLSSCVSAGAVKQLLTRWDPDTEGGVLLYWPSDTEAPELLTMRRKEG
jgi:hypothetical protein